MVKFHVISVAMGTPEGGEDRVRIKDLIRSGHVVSTPRQCGATQALLELLHEDHGGVAALFVANIREGHIYKSRYLDMFHGEKPPAIWVGDQSTTLDGQKEIYTDGLSRFDPTFRQACYENPFLVVKGID